MNKTIYLLLVIVCLIPLMAWAAPNENSEEIIDELGTEFGVLRIAMKHVDYGLAFSMFLDGKLIKNGAQKIYGVYYIKQQPWVLIGSGREAHNPYDLSFLKINMDKSATEVTYKGSGDFVSWEQELDVKTEDNRLVVDLGYKNQKKKLAILENDKISIEYKKVKLNAVTSDDCNQLYEIAKDECTLEDKRADCIHRAIGIGAGSVVELDMLVDITNKPGFNQKGFDKECLKACESGEMADYKSFSKTACGYNK